MLTKSSTLIKQFKYLVDSPYYIKKVLTSKIDKVPKYKSVKEPRVAFCLYGVVGGVKGKSGDNKTASEEILKIGFEYYKKHIFNVNKNVDVFIHTWSRELEKEIKELYKPKLAIMQKQIIFKIPEYTPGKPQRKQNHYSRWYSTKKVIELKSKYERKHKFKYDIVMLSRFDIAWQKDLIFNKFDPDFFYTAKMYTEKPLFGFIPIHIPFGYPYMKDLVHINDLWFFSNSDNINKLATLFDKLNEYTKPGKAPLCEKHGITHHILSEYHLEQIRLIDKLRFIFKHNSKFNAVDPLIRKKYSKWAKIIKSTTTRKTKNNYK